uniref:cysteine and histidine-rich domain-containing protein 1-like isoform X2 n=1 Tax=Myxine glutinosa TaxID=7769 RepID=UPI00358F3DDB
MSLLCYNKGCGQRFDPAENVDEDTQLTVRCLSHHTSLERKENTCCCQHHPGVPIFHDALKSWSCCKKKTTDFSQFLSIPGCTKGQHNPEKLTEESRVAAQQVEGDGVVKKDVINFKALPPPVRKKLPRASADEPLIELPTTVLPSLKQALERAKESVERVEPTDENGGMPEVGTSCKNGGCKVPYQGQESLNETCMYHPGTPVFHEGLKFWSCCHRKTTDFNTFLSFAGCKRGAHCWHQAPTTQQVTCRHDWHQMNNEVVLTMYAKTADPKLTHVRANSTVVEINLTFENEKQFFMKVDLYGDVDVQHSTVTLAASKVEVVLRKAEPIRWAMLEAPYNKKGNNTSDGDANAHGLGEEANSSEDSDCSLGLSDSDSDLE